MHLNVISAVFFIPAIIFLTLALKLYKRKSIDKSFFSLILGTGFLAYSILILLKIYNLKIVFVISAILLLIIVVYELTKKSISK